MTQETLAERAGITWHFVSSIERGTKGATLETLTAVAVALDVSLSERFLDVDRSLPRELRRIETALAAKGLEAQRAILQVVEAALALVDRVRDGRAVANLRAAERTARRR